MITQSLHHDLLTDFVQSHQTFCVIGHEFVDGDAIGSMLGLGGILRAMRKTVTLATTHTPGSVFDFLPGVETVQTTLDPSKPFDAMMFVDFSPLNRIKAFDTKYHDFLLSHQIAIIDHHHETNPLDITVYHKDTTSIATCEIITERAKKSFPDLVDVQTATALLMGIMTDSGNFLFPCDYQRTFANVLWLMERGADKELLVSKLFRSRSWGSVQFLQTVIQRAAVRPPFAWTWAQNGERDRFAIDKQEAKSGMNMIQGVEGIACTLMIDMGETRKIHLRSKHTDHHRAANCSTIGGWFGGGGHIFAAGATIDPRQTFAFDLPNGKTMSVCPHRDGPTALAALIEQMATVMVVE